ncbi:MAG: CidA/LrgA family protein [Planctomycetota bacterium]|nr:CidA/LrgA family protein [Planctomycetota bacterium]
MKRFDFFVASMNSGLTRPCGDDRTVRSRHNCVFTSSPALHDRKNHAHPWPTGPDFCLRIFWRLVVTHLAGRLAGKHFRHAAAFGRLAPSPVSGKFLAETGEFFGTNMAFFFLPPAVDILEQYPLVRAFLPIILLICLLTTIVTFLAAYLAAGAVWQRTGKDA